MQKTELPHPSGLQVFINGKPDLRRAPEEALEIVVSALEPVLSEHFDRYIRRKARDRPNRKK